MQVSNYLISVIFFFFRVPSVDRSTKPVVASGLKHAFLNLCSSEISKYMKAYLNLGSEGGGVLVYQRPDGCFFVSKSKGLSALFHN